MNEEMKKMLEAIAARECWSDDEDFSVYDNSGGNVDDAYSGGCEVGEVLLARQLLKLFGKQ